MQTLIRDLRYAQRALRRAPGFALGVVMVLALGVGANTAMFTVLRATLFRPLAYRAPSQLVELRSANPAGDPGGSRLADVLAWHARAHTLTAVAYYNQDVKTMVSDSAQGEVTAVEASAELLPLLGVAPVLGRSFTAAEQQPGHNHVVLLSDAVWRAQFGADPHVLGQAVRLNDELFTVIGVMPRGFNFPAEIDTRSQVWTPVSLSPAVFSRALEKDTPFFQVIGRRRSSACVAQVTRELTDIQGSLTPLYALTVREIVPNRVEAMDYRHTFHAKERMGLLALGAAVALLWLIACADVASLNLARAASRRRELAVRSSLGATRWRLARGTLVEALLLSTCGGVLGLLLAKATLVIFQHGLAHTFGEGLVLPMDGAVLLGLFLLSLLSAIASGMVPMLWALRGSLEAALRTDGAQAGMGVRQQRLQRVLVVGELALTLCLLVSCGLLARTVLALQAVPLGFRTDHVFSVTPRLPQWKYGDPNTTVYEPSATRLRTLPGVQSLAVTSVAPLAGRFDVNFLLSMDDTPKEGRPNRTISAKLRASGPELQQVLGLRMVQGRFFNATDTPTSQPVMVVNRAFARLYAPLGDLSHFKLGQGSRSFHVVGVIDDFHQQGLAEPSAPEVDLNAAQLRPTDNFYQPTLKAHAEILLRSSRDARSVLPELRHALVAINPDLASAEIETMDQIVVDSMGSQLLAAHLLALLGGLALLVALTGLYSLLAYLVTLRTRELGVRLALGAQRSDILRLVLRGAGGLLLGGAVLGLGLSLAAAHLLSRFLYGLQAYDFGTFAVATFTLLSVGLAAAFVPAQHAAALEPTEALRAE